jgi:stage II sporulation protein AA (anti-sigma F factor antagonist)
MQKNNRNCSLQINEEDENMVIVLKGEVDHHSAVWIRTEIDQMIAHKKPRKAILELSGIDFMDSSGIGLIMGRHARMQAIGGELILRDPNDRIMKIFDLSGLGKIVRIEKNTKKGRSKT